MQWGNCSYVIEFAVRIKQLHQFKLHLYNLDSNQLTLFCKPPSTQKNNNFCVKKTLNTIQHHLSQDPPLSVTHPFSSLSAPVSHSHHSHLSAAAPSLVSLSLLLIRACLPDVSSPWNKASFDYSVFFRQTASGPSARPLVSTGRRKQGKHLRESDRQSRPTAHSRKGRLTQIESRRGWIDI